MMRTAYRQAADTVILLSGDGDLVPGAQELVDFGVGFHLWGVAIGDPRVRQSRELIEVADVRLALDVADLVPFVRPKTAAQVTLLEPTDATEGESAEPKAASPEAANPDQGADSNGQEQSESALAVLTPVKTGAPSLRQLSTPEAIAEDQSTDQIDDVSALEAGTRYGERWSNLIERPTLERFLARYSRPNVPRRIDLDLLWYIAARGRDIDDEAERRGARNGFWDAMEARAADQVDSEQNASEFQPNSD